LKENRLKLANLQLTSAEKFRRIVGIKRETFNCMVDILTEAQKKKKTRGGRPNKLNIPEMLLMTLEYLREYRTYAHIGMSYGLSESNTFTTIKWVEDTLIKNGKFNLPGKKELRKTDNEFEVVLLDATESPIERPKKSSVNFIPVKRNDIH
jgi:Helix-turn-helix of DDE superfamily endonuclease